MSVFNRLKNAWNAFLDKNVDNTTLHSLNNLGYGSYVNPYRTKMSTAKDRTMITSIFNRIATDCSMIDIRHIKVDKNGRYVSEMETYLDDCFKFEANKDQASKSFFIDLVMSMLDEGYVAVVPVDTTLNPNNRESYDILSLRTGKIVQWYPDNVEIDLYNDRTGQHQTIVMPKKNVAIVENPFFAIMNDQNSTLQRIIRKLNLIDYVDAEAGAGKMNLILQLPYVVKTETRKQQVEARIKDIEEQLNNNKYGIAYTDGTEKITQLNRAIENNMLDSVKYLTSILWSQLGIDEAVLNGTANKETMQNYYNRIVKPILEVITDEFTRKFITKTGRTQGQRIRYFHDAFELMPIADLAEIADKFSRNAIMSSNEIRQVIGLKPSEEPIADELSNKNLYNDEQSQNGMVTSEETAEAPEETVEEPADLLKQPIQV